MSSFLPTLPPPLSSVCAKKTSAFSTTLYHAIFIPQLDGLCFPWGFSKVTLERYD